MADYLNNVTLADTYKGANTLGPAEQYDHAQVAVSGASALCQVAERVAGQNPAFDEQREFLIVAGTNSTQSVTVRGIRGIRFRNAIAGKNAQCIAILQGKSGVQFDSGSLFAGVITAAGSVGGTVDATKEVTVSPGLIVPTTEATAVAIVTADPVTVDGATVLEFSFFCPFAETEENFGAATGLTLVLYEDGATVGFLGKVFLNYSGTANVFEGIPIFLRRRKTPAGGTHTYSVRAFADVASRARMSCGAGGAGVYPPISLRIQSVT